MTRNYNRNRLPPHDAASARNINSAKAADTRQRRIDKAIELFLENKPR